jgi:hypothetical protein
LFDEKGNFIGTEDDTCIIRYIQKTTLTNYGSWRKVNLTTSNSNILLRGLLSQELIIDSGKKWRE